MGASVSTQDTPENRWMVFVVSAITQFNARAILEIQSAFDKDSIVISDKTGQYLGTLTGMAVKIPTKLLAPGVGIDAAAGAVAEKAVGGAWDKYQQSKRYKSAKMIQRWLPGMYFRWVLDFINVRQSRNIFFNSTSTPKNKPTNSTLLRTMTPHVNFFAFVFWRKFNPIPTS